MKAIIIIASIAAFGFFAFVMGQVSVDTAPAKPSWSTSTWFVVQVPPTWTGQWLVYKDVLGLWNSPTQAVEAANWLSTNQFPPAP